jgi:hypothetical protein
VAERAVVAQAAAELDELALPLQPARCHPLSDTNRL